MNREIEGCGMGKSFSRVLGHIWAISFIFNMGKENRSSQVPRGLKTETSARMLSRLLAKFSSKKQFLKWSHEDLQSKSVALDGKEERLTHTKVSVYVPEVHT